MRLSSPSSSSLPVPHDAPSTRSIDPAAIGVTLLLALVAAGFATGFLPAALTWVCEAGSGLLGHLLDRALELRNAPYRFHV